MELKILKLENFKGLNFELKTTGNTTEVHGMNRVGKSRLFDAYTFLMFGKDSLGNSDFPIKNINESGDTQHGLDHSVFGVFENPDISLRRTYSEDWGQRGKLKGVFKGHTTRYEIDGVPNKKKKHFDEKVASVCDENLFKMLTDPHHFNEHLHWKERLEILLELSGGMVSDEDVAALHPSLSDFPKILDGKTADDRKEIIKSRKKSIDEEREKIPTRIDEVHKGLAEVRKKADIDKELAEAQENKTEAEEVLKEIKAGGESEVLTTELRRIENKINEIENSEAAARISAAEARAVERRSLNKIVNDIKDDIRNQQAEANRLIFDKESREKRIKTLTQEADRLRQQWYDEDAKKARIGVAEACPACGRSLPQKEVEAAKTKALENFNSEKAETLAAINKRGVTKKLEIQLETKEIAITVSKIDEINERIKALEPKKAEAEAALKEHDEYSEAQEPENTKKVALIKEKETIEKRISEKKAGVDQEAIATGESHVAEIESKITGLKNELLQIDANKRIDVRIKELSERERTLSAQLEELERQLSIIEDFIRKRAKMIESQVNEKFRLTKWKMGYAFLNEGWKDDCFAISNGRPYKALSSSEKTTIGIDIIDTLSEYYQKFPPMFVDNAEHISDIPETRAQQIRLYVSPEHKELFVS